MTWMVVANASGHKFNVNDILGFLCREHFPGIVEYHRVTGSAYSFNHYVVAPYRVDQDDTRFNNKAKQGVGMSSSRYIV